MRNILLNTGINPFCSITGNTFDVKTLLLCKLFKEPAQNLCTMARSTPDNGIGIVINHNSHIAVTFPVTGFINTDIHKACVTFLEVRLNVSPCSWNTPHDGMPVTTEKLCCNTTVEIHRQKGSHHIEVFGESWVMKFPGNGCCLYSMLWTVKSSPHASAFASVINLASAATYLTAVSIGLIRVKINL